MVDYTTFNYARSLKMTENKAIYKSHRNNIEKDHQKDEKHGKSGYESGSASSSYRRR